MNQCCTEVGLLSTGLTGGGWALLMSTPCLESQGCHLIPSFCLLSVILPSPIAPVFYATCVRFEFVKSPEVTMCPLTGL